MYNNKRKGEFSAADVIVRRTCDVTDDVRT